jgi:hypothetical protein
MKRIFLALSLVLVGAPAWAAGNWGDNTTIGVGQCRTFTFNGTDAANAQPSVLVQAGELAYTSIATNGTAMSVSFYEVAAASADPAAATGTRLLYTATGNSSAPTKVETNGGVLDVDIDTDGDGGSVKVCSAPYAMARRGATPTSYTAASVSLTDGDCYGRLITTGVVSAQTFTLPANPNVGMICRFRIVGQMRSFVDVQGATGCTLGAACDRFASHTNLGGDSVASPAFTAFGDALDCAAADADTWYCENKQGSWEDVD